MNEKNTEKKTYFFLMGDTKNTFFYLEQTIILIVDFRKIPLKYVF